MKVSDQGTDGIGGLVLGRGDAFEVLENAAELTRRETLLGHLDLEVEAEKHLREIVVQVGRDLHPLVLSLLCHPV